MLIQSSGSLVFALEITSICLPSYLWLLERILGLLKYFYSCFGQIRGYSCYYKITEWNIWPDISLFLRSKVSLRLCYD